MTPSIAELETRLNSFDPQARAAALGELVALARAGAVPPAVEADVVNMHCHTFYSFNAYGHSPSSLAWLARRQGFRLLGIVDFDVLDGVDEFLQACEVAGVRGTAGIETRVYVPEFATREISSPGEPGVTYHMGIGFTASQPPEAAAEILDAMRSRAARRNQEMVARINAHLAPVTIDYERDVLPLTPGGTPTERHLLAAYMRTAAQSQPDVVAFWAARLGVPAGEVAALAGDTPKLQNLIRARLMKKGGVGYVQAGPEGFTPIGDFHRLVVACGALPCIAWLDGTSPGEEAVDEFLDYWICQGAAALNIIPDRNWNVADPEVRRTKVRKLYEVVRAAEARSLPLNVGTEMNSYGQRLVDDLGVPELTPLRQAFLDGATLVYGHTVLQRALALGYQSHWAQVHLPERSKRNAFYTQVGRLVPPGAPRLAALARLGPGLGPAEVLARLAM